MSMTKEMWVALMDSYWYDPVKFCHEILDFSPDEWQIKVLEDLALYDRVSIRSAQGVGKTGIEACAIIWYLCNRPNSRVVATAPTREQLNSVLWSEVAKWLENSKLQNYLQWRKTKIYVKGNEKRWFAVARTATKPENMQGFHEDYMLFVVDEASGVADKIMEAIDGTLTGLENKLLLCGNPTKSSGYFYDSHVTNRKLFRTHKVSTYDSPRTNKDTAKMLIQKYGEDSNVVRVRVKAEFPKQEADVFVSIEDAENSARIEFEPVNPKDVKIVRIGTDVARFGNNETVIFPNVENEIVRDLVTIRQGQNLMMTVGDIIVIAKELHKRYSQAKIYAVIDDTGLGGGVTDRLAEILQNNEVPGLNKYLEIIPVVASMGIDHDNYDDITTILWGTVRELMKEENLSIPNDPQLIGQLTTRKYTLTSRGKLKLEGKKDMTKRGIDSPDRADALALSCLPINLELESRKGGERR